MAVPTLRTSCRPAARERSRGQILVIFVSSIIVLMGMLAMVVDVSWLWANALRVQRAADAAALAGVVWLPNNPATAYTTARRESTRNGYTSGVAGAVVSPLADAANARRLNVRISAPVDTYFLGIFGLPRITVSRNASAEYVLPVPMGSPQNYYGVFKIRTPSDPQGTRAGAWPTGAQVPDAVSGTLASQGFWGTMINQGADMVNGDAFLAKNDGGGTNATYLPVANYQYGIEMRPGSTGGGVWIFDPVFCATDGSGAFGTGDRWFSGTGATSAFYNLYDTRGTVYDMSDDTLVATSGNFFRNVRASDTTLNGPALGSGVVDCKFNAPGVNSNDPRFYHLRWWQLASGLSGGAAGRVYRLHITSTELANPSAQNGADGHNSFSIETRASGGAPRVYGLGTMEAYSPLNGGGASIFYLAQIEAVHAGKTMEIKLYDPGDTGNLAASLQILEPRSGGYGPATFSYTAVRAAANGVSCNGRSGTGVNAVTTNTGGSSLFNGCWLTITIPLASNYSAPTPPGEPGPGWWKIQYNMSGTSSNTAFDLTTWQVSLRGNPVHLVVP